MIYPWYINKRIHFLKNDLVPKVGGYNGEHVFKKLPFSERWWVQRRIIFRKMTFSQKLMGATANKFPQKSHIQKIYRSIPSWDHTLGGVCIDAPSQCRIRIQYGALAGMWIAPWSIPPPQTHPMRHTWPGLDKASFIQGMIYKQVHIW